GRGIRTLGARRPGCHPARGRLASTVSGGARERAPGVHRDGPVLPAGVPLPGLLRILSASSRARGARTRVAPAASPGLRDGPRRLHVARRGPPSRATPSGALRTPASSAAGGALERAHPPPGGAGGGGGLRVCAPRGLPAPA